MKLLPRKNEPTFAPARGGLGALERRIASHVVMNAMQMDVVPLILCVVGRVGEGKSFNIREILVRNGIAIHEVSGASLAHHKEGMALYPLIRAYRDASAALSEEALSVLLVDDIDRSIASDYINNGHTMHSQLLTGLLMHLCDDPHQIPHEDSRLLCDVQRVPIILTANRVSGLDPALCRSQRMSIFAYELDAGDRQDICERILLVDGHDMRSGLTKADVKMLLRMYPNEPVAFFADVIGRFWSEACCRFLFALKGKHLGRAELTDWLAKEVAKLDIRTAKRLADEERLHRIAGGRSK